MLNACSTELLLFVFVNQKLHEEDKTKDGDAKTLIRHLPAFS